MRYMRRFSTVAEAEAFKKHVLAEADPACHTYMLMIGEDVRVFNATNNPDKIVFESEFPDSDESVIINGLIKGRLLGNDFDYATDRIITESELSKVTTLGTVFASKIVNKKLEPSELQVKDFSTFENFTGITSIDGMSGTTYQNLFGCVELHTVNIPKSVKEIGVSAFAFCINLNTIRMHNYITAIKTKAFYNCTSLTNIEIPASVNVIENNVFNKCENLTKITFKSTTPCKLYKDSLTGISNSCVIYVPASALEMYKQQWKNVANIKGF